VTSVAPRRDARDHSFEQLLVLRPRCCGDCRPRIARIVRPRCAGASSDPHLHGAHSGRRRADLLEQSTKTHPMREEAHSLASASSCLPKRCARGWVSSRTDRRLSARGAYSCDESHLRPIAPTPPTGLQSLVGVLESLLARNVSAHTTSGAREGGPGADSRIALAIEGVVRPATWVPRPQRWLGSY
jgi:hypothetical protein